MPQRPTSNPPSVVPLAGANAWMLCLIALTLFLYLCMVGKPIVIPFVIAFFLWYLLNATARFFGVFRIWKGGRPAPKHLRRLLAVFLLVLLMGTVAMLVRGNIDDVVREAPKFQASFEKIMLDFSARIGVEREPSLAELAALVREHVDIGKIITSFAAMLTAFTWKTMIVVLFMALLFYEQRFFALKVRRMFRRRRAMMSLHRVLKVVDVKIQRYVGVKASVSALDSFLTFTILSLYGVDFAAFWGLMAFFLHFIPYAGSFVAIAMPTVIALIQFGDLWTCLLVLATLCTSHALLGHVLDPYLMGNNLNLSPIFIISNLAIWAMIWGVPGMFLAIPLLAVVAITLSQFPQTRPLAILLSKTGNIDPVLSPENASRAR